MKNLKNYLDYLKIGIEKLDLQKLQRIEDIIFKKIRENKKIFVCGNGGSASVANHFLCDFNKGIKLSSKNKLKPKISFPVFDAIKSAYTIAKIEPVNSQTLIIFFLNI